MINIIGFIAAFLTTVSFLPQVVKTFKTRDTSAISFWMYLIFISGVGMWLIYGILLQNIIIIIANLITMILAGAIFAVKIHNIIKHK